MEKSSPSSPRNCVPGILQNSLSAAKTKNLLKNQRYGIFDCGTSVELIQINPGIIKKKHVTLSVLLKWKLKKNSKTRLLVFSLDGMFSWRIITHLFRSQRTRVSHSKYLEPRRLKTSGITNHHPKDVLQNLQKYVYIYIHSCNLPLRHQDWCHNQPQEIAFFFVPTASFFRWQKLQKCNFSAPKKKFHFCLLQLSNISKTLLFGVFANGSIEHHFNS